MHFLPVYTILISGAALAGAHSLDSGMHKVRRSAERSRGCGSHVHFTGTSLAGGSSSSSAVSSSTAVAISSSTAAAISAAPSSYAASDISAASSVASGPSTALSSASSLASTGSSAIATATTSTASAAAASGTATSSASASNPVILQSYNWYTEGGGTLYTTLEEKAAELAEMGITMVWLPPATKAGGGSGSVGYDIYDLWDLGEFDQKGSTATKWGTKDELVSLISTFNSQNITTLLDAVLNQKTSADDTETFKATQVSSTDRLETTSDLHEIEGQTVFKFDGRGGKYSTLQWNYTHFTGVAYDVATDTSGVFLIEGKEWSTEVSTENGNYDFLIFDDVCYANQEVRDDILAWGKWVLQETGAGGFRLDAMKHYNASFAGEFLRTVRSSTSGSDFFAVGEYWSGSPSEIEAYLDDFTGGDLHMFDAPLHYNFYNAANDGTGFDLSTILDDSLVASRPNNSVTFVDNHDTQPTQGLESWVTATFKPLAYALILLREGGVPTVFAGDLWGIDTDEPVEAMSQLSDFVKARKWFGYGSTTDYFDDASTVGWVRSGDANHDPVAVLMSIGTEEGSKKMQVAGAEEGEVYTDLLGWNTEEVTIEAGGYATFKCPAQSVSIWTRTDARGRENFDN
ncbi:hypothetical protein JCM8547_006268 [Rhodosporidiobolus lusitaniae]